MTAREEGIEAAAQAVYARLRAVFMAQQQSPIQQLALSTVMPEQWERLHEQQREHYRAVAAAAVDAWTMHVGLYGADQ